MGAQVASVTGGNREVYPTHAYIGVNVLRLIFQSMSPMERRTAKTLKPCKAHLCHLAYFGTVCFKGVFETSISPHILRYAMVGTV